MSWQYSPHSSKEILTNYYYYQQTVNKSSDESFSNIADMLNVTVVIYASLLCNTHVALIKNIPSLTNWVLSIILT